MKNPKFKVGDIVRIIDPDTLKLVGRFEGEVLEVGGYLRQYHIRPLDEWAAWIKEGRLRLVSREEGE